MACAGVVEVTGNAGDSRRACGAPNYGQARCRRAAAQCLEFVAFSRGEPKGPLVASGPRHAAQKHTTPLWPVPATTGLASVIGPEGERGTIQVVRDMPGLNQSDGLPSGGGRVGKNGT